MEMYAYHLYAVSLFLGVTVSFPDGCTTVFDQIQCITYADCLNDVDTIVQFEDDVPDNCTIMKTSHFYPLEIKIKTTKIHSQSKNVPFSNGKYQYGSRYNYVNSVAVIDVITALDISNYGDTELPDLQEMNKLTKLNLSYNHFDTIKLSTINELTTLTNIDMSYNNLETVPMLDSLGELIFLNLSHNLISILGPLSFEGIKKLNYLYLADNRITDINSSLFRFKELEELDLSNNKLEIITCKDFDYLRNLKKLKLNDNYITKVETLAFTNMTLLKTLDFSNNKIESLNKIFFMNLTFLFDLNLSNNFIKSLPKDAFKGKCISYFSITYNLLDGALQRGTFEGLKFVSNLDLSYQYITSIEDYAFFGVDELRFLLLNNNDIESLSKKSFKTLHNLEILDLSNNKLISIDFEKEDLLSLRSFSLKNNYLFHLSYEDLHGMSLLQLLDMSNNNISHIEPKAFQSLQDLISFAFSSNPIKGVLEVNTFYGLNSLPSLDISCTSLTEINNNSFSGMIQLKIMNMSRSKIETLHFNSFLSTGNIETLDLSHNLLREFNINCTELQFLKKIFLNYNFLKKISATTFRSLPNLLNIVLSHNQIKHINGEAFHEQESLQLLDLSYNKNLNFNLSLIEKAPGLLILLLSGISTNITFTNIDDVKILELDISNSGIANVTTLNVKELKQLKTLILSNNDIDTLKSGAFNNMSSLKNLDLSFNRIKYIQPGVFKDNSYLECLNISHNLLNSVSYGVLRGLIYLRILDISFNNIDSLKSERFYEAQSLTDLIVDHNKINYVDAEEFRGTSLTKLSIGENPLPCEILVNFKRNRVPFEVTAIKIVEGDVENSDGVTCKEDIHFTKVKLSTGNGTTENEKVLINIRDILYNISKEHVHSDGLGASNIESSYNSNISNFMYRLNNESHRIISNLFNFTVAIASEKNNTNVLLEKILKALSLSNYIRNSSLLRLEKDNETQSVIPYLNKIKQDLEDNVVIEKHNILKEIDEKIASIKNHVESLMTTTSSPIKEKSTEHETLDTAVKSPNFTEICVALILLILVIYVLYKVCKTRMSQLSKRTLSTRQIVNSMESSNL